MRTSFLALFLLPLVGCGLLPDMPGNDTTEAPKVCSASGLTATDSDGRILATPDALIKGEMAVHICDDSSPTGDRWLLVKGIGTGVEKESQGGLLIDKGGKTLRVDRLTGITSTSQRTVPGTRFTAACHDLVGGGCGKVKTETPAANSTITISVPKGTKVEVK